MGNWAFYWSDIIFIIFSTLYKKTTVLVRSGCLSFRLMFCYSGTRLDVLLFRYKALFEQTDNDKDGFISGVEIKNVFLQTGLPQNILAHIWNLCDMRQEGKLNPEQFALAMYLVQQKQAGKDPPAQLTPDMVPPSMRPKVKIYFLL